MTELAKPFPMSMPAVSKHLKVLQRTGFISRGREAQWRPRRLDAEPLKDAAAWIEHYRRFWPPYLDALERHLDRMGKLMPMKRKTRRRRRGRGREHAEGEMK